MKTKNLQKFFSLGIFAMALAMSGCSWLSEIINSDENDGNNDTVYFVDISKETDWDYMLVGGDGSSAFVCIDKNDIPTQLFFRPEKHSDNGYTVFFQENGLPRAMVVEDHILHFGNFQGDKCDMAVIYPDNSISYFFNISTNVHWDSYSDIFRMNGALHSNSVLTRTGETSGKSLGYVGNALGFTSCITGLVFLRSVGGYFGCGATFAGLLTNNNKVKMASTGIGGVTTLIGCASFKTGIGAIVCVLGITELAFSSASLAIDFIVKADKQKLIDKVSEQFSYDNVFKPYQIRLSSYKIDVPYMPARASIDVNTQSQWEIDREDMGWCVARKVGNSKIDIEIKQPYTMGGTRTATFMVYSVNFTSVPPAYFTVEQIGIEYKIEPTSLNFKVEGGKDDFTVILSSVSGASIDVDNIKLVNKKDEEWCKISFKGGLIKPVQLIGVVANVAKNTGSSRTALVEIPFKIGNSGMSTVVEINQEGMEEPSIHGQWNIEGFFVPVYLYENRTAKVNWGCVFNGTWSNTEKNITMRFICADWGNDHTITFNGTINENRNRITGNWVEYLKGLGTENLTVVLNKNQ